MPVKYIDSMLLDIKAFGWAHRSINDSCLMPGLNGKSSSVGNTQIVDQNPNVTKHRYIL